MGGMSSSVARPGPRVESDPAAGGADAVVSSPASSATGLGKPSRPARPGESRREGHEQVGVAVGPGLASPALRAGMGGYRLNPLEIQPAKIHCPPPREDWLSRERLNSWLDRAASGRLGLIVAEAGFGKTTLLADWAMHTRRATAWYRLEPDDRDWLTFIRHLVAGGRELDREFAPATYRLLHSLGPGGPTPGDLTASIAREMAAFGAATPAGLTLIVDDYHVVDGDPDTDPIMRALLDRTGPGFSMVIATRSMPRLSVGRLRARGGVMTIDGESLCFDMDETSRLFRDAYRRPLEDDVVSDLHDRTEGWPALLTLVRTGLDDRESADPRALVAGMDASRGDLYEFLAEEVMGSMPPELQHFLTRVSVLMAVDVESAMLVDDRPADAIAAAIRESERLGLLSRPDRESPHRFHHLVREFLASRLEAEIGDAEVKVLHRSIADRLRGKDWYGAAWHYLMGGDADKCASVVDGALDEIIASGQFQQVRRFLAGDAGDPNRTVALILRSRVELGHGNTVLAEDLATSAVGKAGQGELRGIALLSLISATSTVGLDDKAVALASEALVAHLTPSQRDIALGSVLIRGASVDGDLNIVSQELRRLASSQEAAGETRYAGITRQNLATVLVWLGRSEDAHREASRAETLLGGLANPSYERAGATALRAVAKAQLGKLADARAIVAAAGALDHLARQELATESARLELEFGSLDNATAAIAVIDEHAVSPGWLGIKNLLHGQAALRRNDQLRALDAAAALEVRPSLDAAGAFRSQLVYARAALALDHRDRRQRAQAVLLTGSAHRSRPTEMIGRMLVAMAGGEESLNEAVLQTRGEDSWIWSLIAEEIADRLAELTAAGRAAVRDEAARRRERWSSALRLTIARTNEKSGLAAAMLADIGDPEDAAFLHGAALTSKALRPAAARIIQRVAPEVRVLDLGVVDVRLGTTSVKRKLRRSVLALLCFLSSRPHMASSRDEALEALWPDLAPTAGSNSMHQAIYFLRRVFEPNFREGMSADYIQFDGDVIALNGAMVRTASARCWELVQRGVPTDRANAEELVSIYSGKFALDFAYEDWASDYRDSLHAGVLSVIERDVKRSRVEGDMERTIRLAQAILAIDPTADSVELELVLAYRASGRRAAAAEQYAHYSAFVREELGSTVPALDDLA
jgi:DNA-binding SARP family transcriptional activator